MTVNPLPESLRQLAALAAEPHDKHLLALFAGPPGSGKTHAATQLATRLRAPLLRIDPGTLSNKYIGETEKNIARLFDAAADLGMVLLFDEADALFGKRSTARDAHDRYANQETAYLLQRMETHPGLVILTSNQQPDRDSALPRDARILRFPLT